MLRVLLLTTFVALAGCASTGTEAAGDDGPTASVEVQNRNWIAMEIFATAQGQRVRLGRLSAGRERTYTLPGRLFAAGPTAVAFEMEADGSEREVLRETISVAPGETVILVIPNTR
ncbi:MAG: hypothetical protein AAF845_04480 [Bacteroidota bacterium]